MIRVLPIVAILLVWTPVHAKTLKEAMEDVSVGIASQLKKADAEKVQVLLPRGPVDDAAKQRMRLELVSALRANGINVDPKTRRPDFRIALDYTRSDQSTRYAMSIRLLDRSAKSLGSFNGNFDFVPGTDDEKVEVSLNAPTDRARLEGKTIDVTRDADDEPRNATRANTVETLARKPSSFVSSGSIVSASAASLFRIEVLVKQPGSGAYEPLSIETEDGFAYADLADGDVYAVRVHNGAEFEVAVDLGIDGINMWQTSRNKAWKKLGKFVVPAGDSVTMKGWHFGETGPGDYREFKVVEFPDSLGDQLGTDQSANGQIHAQFFAAWADEASKPEVERRTTRGGTTGVGDPTHQETKNVHRFIGTSLLAAVTIRYAREFPEGLPNEPAPEE